MVVHTPSLPLHCNQDQEDLDILDHEDTEDNDTLSEDEELSK